MAKIIIRKYNWFYCFCENILFLLLFAWSKSNKKSRLYKNTLRF